jgi:hypothetical protein
MSRPHLLLFGALIAFAGCGGGGEGRNGGDEPRIPGSADPNATRVIYDWVNALHAGRVEAASKYFAVPSLVQNGTPPLRLGSRRAVVAFNRSLPCGAKLIHADAAGRFVNATFRLTERPGGACGPGAGAKARTAFVIRDGKIVEWRRLPDHPSAPTNAPLASI